jgi:tRNA threonylcarbamoyladenosine biosynthesis protein TsaE
MKICGEQAMKEFGARLIRSSARPAVITLLGDLGSGKTTLVRGALEACGVTSGVRSPTYTLVEYYPLEHFNIAHFDLYRLADAEELEYLGYRDYLDADTWCFIEWPQRAEGFLENVDLQIEIEYAQECREIKLQALSEWGEAVASKIQKIS